MPRTQWVEWTRTALAAREREELLAALTSEQKAQLREQARGRLSGPLQPEATEGV